LGPWATANYCRAGIKSLRGTTSLMYASFNGHNSVPGEIKKIMPLYDLNSIHRCEYQRRHRKCFSSNVMAKETNATLTKKSNVCVLITFTINLTCPNQKTRDGNQPSGKLVYRSRSLVDRSRSLVDRSSSMVDRSRGLVDKSSRIVDRSTSWSPESVSISSPR